LDKILYLESDEEITSIIDRIKGTEEGSIILVVPRGATLIQSMINLKLLKREVGRLRKTVAIVTTDNIGRNLASQVGITAYQKLDKVNLEEKPDEIEKTPVSKFEKKDKLSFSEIKFNKKPIQEAKSPDQNIAQKIKENAIPKIPKKIDKKLIIGGVVLVLIVAAVLGLFILPKATIAVTVKTSPYPEEFNLSVSSKVDKPDTSENLIPGEVVSQEKESTGKGTSTGTKETGAKAKGTITVYNFWDSNPQPMVVGTRFSSPSGLIFKTTQPVTVPGTKISEGNTVPGTAAVSVESEKEGANYNIGASNFVIPGLPAAKQAKIYGKSTAAMSGGFTKQITVVSQADIDKTAQEVADQLKTEVSKEISDGLSQDRMIITDAISEEITEKISTPAVNSEASEFEVKVKVKLSTLSFAKADLEEIAKRYLADKIPSDKQLVGLQEGISAQLDNIDLNTGEMKAKVKISASVAPKIDESAIVGNAKGRTKDEVKAYLEQYDEIDKVDVKLSPFWVRKVPTYTKKIKITTDYSSSSEVNK
jgi:hypothetical protein